MKKYIIPTLAFAGINSANYVEGSIPNLANDPNIEPEIKYSVLNFTLPFQLAGHSSHKSHGSHSSHGSHRSSSSGGGSYSAPSPSYNSTTPESILPKIRPNNPSYNDIVLEVQVCLEIKGYNPGPIDGILGSKTTIAIARAQSRNSLPITGKIDEKLIKLCKYGALKSN